MFIKREGFVGLVLVCVASVLMSTASTFADFIPIQDAPGSELSVEYILRAVTADATLEVDGDKRMSDCVDCDAAPGEIVWENKEFDTGITAITYLASCWGQTSAAAGNLKHVAGYHIDATSTEILDTSSLTPNTRVVLGADIVAPGDDIYFYADNSKYAKAWSSPDANLANQDGQQDRMIVFNVTDDRADLVGLDGNVINSTDGNNLYLMFFDTGMDGDFNDFVMLVEDNANDAAPPAPEPEEIPDTETPEPGSAALLITAAAILTLRPRRN